MENKRNKVQNFYKRWNIEYDQEERIDDFKSRVLSMIDTIVVPFFVRIDQNMGHFWLSRYFRVIGIYIPDSEYKDYLNRDNTNTDTYRKIFTKYLNSKIEDREIKVEKIIFYFHNIFDLEKDIIYEDGTTFKEILYRELKENIDLSLLDVRIKRIGSKFIIYPVGVRLLDENVVNDVIDFLDKYPKTQKHFTSALQKYQEHKYERNLIDDLRLSLELLLKEKDILDNKKSLEKQKDALGKYLKIKNVPTEIRNMFGSLITYYGNYQNECAKHDDKVRKVEIEFTIYLTGTIMRFLLNL